MSSMTQYFVPVCLYPHTKYRTRAGVIDLFERYELHSHHHLIVIADRLLVLDRLVTGRYWSVAAMATKARQEAEQILNLIKRVAHKMAAQSRGRIVFWDEIAEAGQFCTFSDRLRGQILTDHRLAGEIEEFVERRVARFGLGSLPERERAYEREYLLSEVCMSVFCTEVLGFSNEVWERPPAANVPDPLKLLYENRAELVTRVTGRPVARRLHFLYSDRSRHADHVQQAALAEG
jgi:hypothetical protein